MWAAKPEETDWETRGYHVFARPRARRVARALDILKQGLRCSGACRLGHGVGRAAFAPTSFHGAFRNFSSQWAPLDRTVGWFSIYRLSSSGSGPLSWQEVRSATLI